MAEKKLATVKTEVKPEVKPEIPTMDEKDKLELRKVKALEKIANSLDSLTVWFEEVDKNEWSERIQWYLSEFYRMKKTETPGEFLDEK